MCRDVLCEDVKTDQLGFFLKTKQTGHINSWFIGVIIRAGCQTHKGTMLLEFELRAEGQFILLSNDLLSEWINGWLTRLPNYRLLQTQVCILSSNLPSFTINKSCTDFFVCACLFLSVTLLVHPVSSHTGARLPKHVFEPAGAAKSHIKYPHKLSRNHTVTKKIQPNSN